MPKDIVHLEVLGLSAFGISGTLPIWLKWTWDGGTNQSTSSNMKGFSVIYQTRHWLIHMSEDHFCFTSQTSPWIHSVSGVG